MKKTYDTILITNLYSRRAMPGDEIALALHNEQGDENMYAQAERLYTMFVLCYGFFPESIAMHPDHLALLKKMGKRLDVLIDEKAAEEIGKEVELTTLPRSIPLIADASLDIFTTVARYRLPYEQAGDRAIAALFNYLGVEREKRES